MGKRVETSSRSSHRQHLALQYHFMGVHPPASHGQSRPRPSLPYPTLLPAATVHRPASPIQSFIGVFPESRNRRLPFLSRQMRKASEVAPPGPVLHSSVVVSVSIILLRRPARRPYGNGSHASPNLGAGTTTGWMQMRAQRLEWRGGRPPQQLGSSARRRRGRRHLRSHLQLRARADAEGHQSK